MVASLYWNPATSAWQKTELPWDSSSYADSSTSESRGMLRLRYRLVYGTDNHTYLQWRVYGKRSSTPWGYTANIACFTKVIRTANRNLKGIIVYDGAADVGHFYLPETQNLYSSNSVEMKKYAHFTLSDSWVQLTNGTNTGDIYKSSGDILLQDNHYNLSIAIQIAAATYYQYKGTWTIYDFSINTTVSLVFSAPNSTISATTNPVRTNAPLSVAIQKNNASYWHQIKFKYGNIELYTSDAFAESSYTYSVPRTWLTQDTTKTSLTITAVLSTYKDAALSEKIGNDSTFDFAVIADDGMKPVMTASNITLEPVQAGGFVGMTGYISDISKVKASFSGVDVSACAGATIDHYQIDLVLDATILLSVSGASPLQILTRSPYAYLAYAIDTRGRVSNAVTVIPAPIYTYSNPTMNLPITPVRCLSDGTQDDEGSYFKLKASASCASLGGQNSIAIACTVTTGGHQVFSDTISNNVEEVLAGSLDSSKTHIVAVTVTDTVGNSKTITAILSPARYWIASNEAQNSVGIGRVPVNQNALELAEGYSLVLNNTTLTEAQLIALLNLI